MHIANRFMTRVFVALALLVTAPVLMALEKETLPFWEIVSCPGEEVEIVGTVRFQTHLVESGNHATWIFQAFWTGHGQGLESETRYLLKGKWMEVVQANPPFIFVLNDHFQLVGKGSAPNYRFNNKVKIVVNANGDVIIDRADSDEPCEYIDGGVG